MLSAAVWRR